jgi:uncharacterized membrane protein (DUF4010 family)
VDALIEQLPPEVVGFVLTLVLSVLIGIEREEHEPEGLGGVRTFPIIGLSGFLLVEVFPDSTVPFALGLVVLGSLVALSHWANLQRGEAGITTEVAALLTFSIGAAAARGLYWLAISGGVIAVILLQEKTRLEGLAAKLPTRELGTLVRFLLLTGVILPALPNRPFTPFELNPFKIWLVVVAVSGVSYLSYLLQLRWDRGRGLFLAGVLGGAYSSTVTTVVLARKSKQQRHTDVNHVGAITAATGVMYLRLWILLLLFAAPLARELTVLFWSFGLVALGSGALLCRLRSDSDDPHQAPPDTPPAGNPLEMSSAFTFAGIFVAVLMVTRLVAERFGGTGVLVMAAIMGAADVDPFILGLTQYVDHGLGYATAALAVVIAAAANNLIKGVYAAIFGSPTTGRLSLAILSLLGLASLAVYLAAG